MARVYAEIPMVHHECSRKPREMPTVSATQVEALVHENIIPNNGKIYKINIIPLIPQTIGNSVLPSGDGTQIDPQRVSGYGPTKHKARSSRSLIQTLSLYLCTQGLQFPFLWLECSVYKYVTCTHMHLPNTLGETQVSKPVTETHTPGKKRVVKQKQLGISSLDTTQLVTPNSPMLPLQTQVSLLVIFLLL